MIAPARADWSFTLFAGASARTRTGFIDLEMAASRARPMAGAAAMWERGWWAAETDVVFAPGFFSGSGDPPIVVSSSMLALTGSGVVRVPRRWSVAGVRPYGVVGAGAMRLRSRDLEGIFPIDAWQAIVTAGGGLSAALTSRLAVRADARYTRSTRKAPESAFAFGDVYLDFWRITAGATVTLR